MRVAAVALAAVLAITGCGSDPERSPGPAESSGPREAARTEPAEVVTAEAAEADQVPPELEPALADRPDSPDTAGEAARFVIAAEQAIADRTSSREVVAAAGHTAQLVYRELSQRPRWEARVLARVPAALRRVVRDNVAARRQFRSMHPSSPGDLADELPAWRIVAPARPETLRAAYGEAERRYGIDWEYLAAINMVETAFGRIRGTSVAGAQGPMQFIPTTWDIYGEGDVHDPHDAIMAAARLLRANGFARDKAAALYRYNNSTAYVRGVTLHAEVMRRQPRSYLGYHQWQVYYLTQRGSVWLPEGYAAKRPVPVDRYLERHPERLPD